MKNIIIVDVRLIAAFLWFVFMYVQQLQTIPSELDSEVLFFSSPSTGVNSSELEHTQKKSINVYTQKCHKMMFLRF